MPLAYVPPGVNVEELYSPSVNPLLSVSASVCLVGLAQGYQVGKVQVTFDDDGSAQTITAPAGSVFQAVDSDTAFVSVKNVLDPTQGSIPQQGGYLEDTDFETALSGDSKVYTITPLDGAPATAGDLESVGGTLEITYRFIPGNYYEPIRLDTQSAIEARFGPAFNKDGIVTPLSAAAALAFENGASSVVVQPLFIGTTTKSQPVVDNDSSDVALAPTWENTLAALRDVEDVNIIVPVVGASDPFVGDSNLLNILYEVQDHMNYMQTQGQYIIGIFGEDASASLDDATLDVLRTHAGLLRSRHTGLMAEQTVLISPSRFRRVLPSNNNKSILVGGQYVAAALSGMIAARSVVVPLTRKQVSGFVAVEYPNYDKAAKNKDAQEGLLVVEQKGSFVQVRHGTTLNNEGTATRELSVVRAKHRMIESVRQTIDDQIIGTVPADGNAPLVVKNAVIGVLESLRQRRELVDYTGVQARTLTNDPTTVECRFSYRPAFPLNYVNVVFSLDLSAGEISTTTTTVATV